MLYLNWSKIKMEEIYSRKDLNTSSATEHITPPTFFFFFFYKKQIWYFPTCVHSNRWAYSTVEAVVEEGILECDQQAKWKPWAFVFEIYSSMLHGNQHSPGVEVVKWADWRQGERREQCSADGGRCGKAPAYRTGVTWGTPCGGRRARRSHLSLDSVWNRSAPLTSHHSEAPTGLSADPRPPRACPPDTHARTLHRSVCQRSH